MAELMNNFLIYLVALVITLGVLIAFHEFGHFWVARRLGVKVLRYSIGFGKPLWLRKSRKDGTEYAVAAIPLGGYVKMLDEREGEVAAHDLARAFNRQSVWTRIAIVAAGPLANFLFAILAFAAMYMVGVSSVTPLLGAPSADSIAERAGFRDRDLIVAVNGEPVETLKSALLGLVDAATARPEIDVEVRTDDGRNQSRVLDLTGAGDVTEDGRLLENLGLNPWQPALPAVIDSLVAGSAGERAGLRPGDEIVAVDGRSVSDWVAWAELIQANPGRELSLTVRRDGAELELGLVPDTVTTEQGEEIGRVGAYARVPDDFQADNRAELRLGPLAALARGAEETWHMSGFVLRMLGRMVIGKVSLDNISGPVTIAQFAGQSAMIGLTAFLSFMAMVSISLGVLNLLPVPILDGGHLLFYLIEIVKGSPVSENAQYVGQQVGLGMIVMLMGLALFNDFSRLLG